MSKLQLKAYVGFKMEDIDKALSELLSSGFVAKDSESENALYSLTDSGKTYLLRRLL